jgi:hypothetical protein
MLKALGVCKEDRDFIKAKVKEIKADEKKKFKMLLELNTKKRKMKA